MSEDTKAKREVTIIPVTMSDGRVVEFAGKRKMLKQAVIADNGSISLRIDFINGQTRLLPLNPTLYAQYAGHGAEQKFGDECAGLEDVDDMVLAVDKLHERVNEQGQWNMRREGSGFAGTSVLARALAELYGKPIEAIKAFLSDKTTAEKNALRGNPKVKPIVDRIESEKAKKGPTIDSDALLAAIPD